MTEVLDTPLRDFLADLARIEHLLRLTNMLKAFGGTVIVDTQENLEGFCKEAIDLRAQIREQRTDFPLLSGALLLYLAGRFEYFIRSCFESTAEGIAEKCQKFSDLPERLQKSLLQNTADTIRNPSRYGFDDVQAKGFVTTLAENLQAENGLGEINSACLSVTEQNMWPDTLSDLFGRIGIQRIWEEIGKQADMKILFQLEREDGVSRQAKAKLSNLMQDRNQIAHPSVSTIFQMQIRSSITSLFSVFLLRY
jgi:hypothetical protein